MKVKLFFEHPKNELGFLELFLGLLVFLGTDVSFVMRAFQTPFQKFDVIFFVLQLGWFHFLVPFLFCQPILDTYTPSCIRRNP